MSWRCCWRINFVVIDYTLSKLTSLKEYIDDTDDFINIQLDNVRNQLIRFELLLATATFVVAIFRVVSGVFGMNFEVPLFKVPHAFECTLARAGVCGAVIFCSFLWYFKERRFFPLVDGIFQTRCFFRCPPVFPDI